MARTTLEGHVSRAIDFYNKNNLYFGIGRSTPWDDEYAPPVPTDREQLVELIGMKKVEQKFLVYPIDPPEGERETGTVNYQGTWWKIANLENAVEVGARWVYVMSKFSYSELPTDTSFRQVGLYSGVQHNQSGDPYVLLPDQITDDGLLEVIDNRKAVYREVTQQEKLVLIVQL